MLCEICAAEEAAFTIIPVAEGMPQTLGPACYARSGLEFAKAVLPPEEIAQTLGPMFVTPGRAQALAKAPKRRKAEQPAEMAGAIGGAYTTPVENGVEEPKPTPEPEPKPEPPPGEPQEPAAAADA